MKKTKIGILTYHNTLNYGATLQAYALARKCHELGYECEIVNYVCKPIMRAYTIPMGLAIGKIPKSLFSYLISSPWRKTLKREFDAFRNNYMSVSDKKYIRKTIHQAEREYDMFIVGSDQVWNTDLTFSDNSYFLDFIKDGKKKNSYAASFGRLRLSSIDEVALSKLLKDFQRILVREAKALDLLSQLGRLDGEVVLDPTFLLTRDHWNDICARECLVKKAYLLLFKVPNSYELDNYVQEYAKKNGLEIIYIHRTVRGKPYANSVRCASPQHFLQLIRDAHTVVTGSFHGICFSLIFEKNFYYALQPNDRNVRMQDIMALIGLTGREIINGRCAFEGKEIEYSDVQAILEKQRDRSVSLLSHMLAQDT